MACGRGTLKPMTAPRQATLHTVIGRDRAQGGKEDESEEALGSEDCEEALEHEDGEQASEDGKSEDAEEKGGCEGGEEESRCEGGNEEESRCEGGGEGNEEESRNQQGEEGNEELEEEESGCEGSEEGNEEGSGGEDSREDVVEISGRFLPNHPFLVGLRQYLLSRHGKGRSEREANQISSAVSQFLSFADPAVLDPTHLYNATMLDRFLRHLETQGKKASTQHATLCRVKQCLTYVNLTLDPAETIKAEKCLTLISNWLSTLGKEARRAKRVHLEEMCDRSSSVSMSEIERFSRSEKMMCLIKTAAQKIDSKEMISQTDLRKITVWLAGSLLHCNAQRPGAVTNTTLSEYQAATLSSIGRETYRTILVVNHKTATTGRAKLTADRSLTKQLDLFVAKIRSALEGSESNLLFPNRDGKAIDHLSRHVQNLATKLGIKLPRTATATRHAAATAAAVCGEAERTTVAAAMSHSKQTQEVYYTLNKGTKDAVQGYRVMEEIRRDERQGGAASSARMRFSTEEKQVVSDFFAEHISSRRAPSIDQCREFLRDHPIERTAKQIRDKVRNMIGR